MSRQYTLGTVTDLQMRLNYINEKAKGLQERRKEDPDIAELAYLVAYLSGILHKHLATSET
jgi:hypothetical protein